MHQPEIKVIIRLAENKNTSCSKLLILVLFWRQSNKLYYFSIIVPLLPEDTVNLEPGEYDFDFAVRTSANETYTVLKGKLDLEYDVTKTAGTAGTA